jgi:hypothetical protein
MGGISKIIPLLTSVSPRTPTRSHGGATIEEAPQQLWRVPSVLSLDSFSRLHFPDGSVRPEFRQKLLDSGITPEQIAWLEEDVAEEMEEWRRRKKQRCDGMDVKYSAT